MGDAWVVKALRLSEELEVDETGTKVRRRTEVQEPKGQFERSVYAVRVWFGFLTFRVRVCVCSSCVERVSG